MNKKRRKDLEEIAEELNKILATRLEALIDEEQEAYDNMPESLQNGSKGEKMSEVLDLLNTAKSDLENSVQELFGVVADY